MSTSIDIYFPGTAVLQNSTKKRVQ